jgi:hypothetical protein
MHLRTLSLLIVALFSSTQASPVAAATDRALPKGVSPVTAVYVAKGAADSCGAGCDRWIAVEGRMDTGAAARLRALFRSQNNVALPIYLHSPGGDVRQGLAMGRMLRERKAIGRVGRTVVKACAADAQAEPACLKLKQTGRELEAELTASGAYCNSSCAYLLFGAAVREVSPDVTVGVHSARVTLRSRGRALSQTVLDRASQRAIDGMNREIAGYLAAMGIDRSLFDLVKTVSFERMHALKRDELVRFGIDKRELVETNWVFTDRGTRSSIDKVVQVRNGPDTKDVRTQRWRLTCAYGPRMVLSYLRGNGDETLASAVVRFGADQKIVMGAQVRSELRSVIVEANMIEKLKSATQLSLMEVGPVASAAGDETPVRETVLSTAGLPRSIELLAVWCRS